MHENKRRRKYICILKHVLGNLRIILYRSTRDCLICSHAIEQWARVGCNGRSRARLLPATCKPGSHQLSRREYFYLLVNSGVHVLAFRMIMSDLMDYNHTSKYH